MDTTKAPACSSCSFLGRPCARHRPQPPRRGKRHLVVVK